MVRTVSNFSRLMGHAAFALAASAFLFAWSGAARANLIANGSFETPVVPSGSYTDFPNGSAGITGWTVFGTGGSVDIVSGSLTNGSLSFPAEDGIQWLDLTGISSNSTEGVQQSVSTVIGNQYQLTFYVGNVYNPGGAFGRRAPSPC
jgi:Protein of unknown function (DUF642)